MHNLVRALRHHNFRLYFLAQNVSLIGTWVQQVAMAWLVYRLTGSALLLGVVGFAGQIPILVFAPFGGIWSDRFDRRVLLLWTQTLSLLQALLLALLVLGHWVEVWHLIATSIFLGIINALDAPARQSFVVQLVDDRNDLPNAIALNSFTINSARLIGPPLAGMLVSVFGEGLCFLLNGFSFLTVIVALMRMKVRDTPRTRHSMMEGFRQGVAYAAGFPPMRALLLLVAVVGFTVTPYVVLMPVYAKEVFHGDAQTLGLLTGCAGFGALMGTLFLASRKNVVGLGKIIAWAALCAGGGLMAFAFSSQLWLTLPALAVTGFGIIVAAASTNMVIQTVVPDDLRGRVMSLFTMAFLGMAPLGSLAAGSLAHHIGAAATLFSGGVVSLVAAAVFARELPHLRAHMHPIYVRQGLLEAGPVIAGERGQAADL